MSHPISPLQVETDDEDQSSPNHSDHEEQESDEENVYMDGEDNFNEYNKENNNNNDNHSDNDINNDDDPIQIDSDSESDRIVPESPYHEENNDDDNGNVNDNDNNNGEDENSDDNNDNDADRMIDVSESPPRPRVHSPSMSISSTDKENEEDEEGKEKDNDTQEMIDLTYDSLDDNDTPPPRHPLHRPPPSKSSSSSPVSIIHKSNPQYPLHPMSVNLLPQKEDTKTVEKKMIFTIGSNGTVTASSASTSSTPPRYALPLSSVPIPLSVPNSSSSSSSSHRDARQSHLYALPSLSPPSPSLFLPVSPSPNNNEISKYFDSLSPSRPVRPNTTSASLTSTSAHSSISSLPASRIRKIESEIENSRSQYGGNKSAQVEISSQNGIMHIVHKKEKERVTRPPSPPPSYSSSPFSSSSPSPSPSLSKNLINFSSNSSSSNNNNMNQNNPTQPNVHRPSSSSSPSPSSSLSSIPKTNATGRVETKRTLPSFSSSHHHSSASSSPSSSSSSPPFRPASFPSSRPLPNAIFLPSPSTSSSPPKKLVTSLRAKHPLMKERLISKGIPIPSSSSSSHSSRPQDDEGGIMGAVMKYKDRMNGAKRRDEENENEDGGYYNTDYGYGGGGGRYNPAPSSSFHSSSSSSSSSSTSSRGMGMKGNNNYSSLPLPLPLSSHGEIRKTQTLPIHPAQAKSARHTKSLAPVRPPPSSSSSPSSRSSSRSSSPTSSYPRFLIDSTDVLRTILQWAVNEIHEIIPKKLKSSFVDIPIEFHDEHHYQHVFYPFLVEEFRAGVASAIDETRLQHREKYNRQKQKRNEKENGNKEISFDFTELCEYLITTSYITTDHFVEVEMERIESSRSSSANNSNTSPLFVDNDLILMWPRQKYNPSVLTHFNHQNNHQNQNGNDPSITMKEKLLMKYLEWESSKIKIFGHIVRLKEKDSTTAASNSSPSSHHSSLIVRYKVRVVIDKSTAFGQSLQQSLLPVNSQWAALPLTTLKTLLREFKALQMVGKMELSKYLFSPILQKQQEEEWREKGNHWNSSLSLDPSVGNDLNSSQRKAITSSLTSLTGFSLIQGPAGTGKTSTLLGLIRQLLSTPSSPTAPPVRLLICAPSNAAIDEIVARILLTKGSEYPLDQSVVRVGAGRREERGGGGGEEGMVDAVDIESILDMKLRKERERGNNAKNEGNNKEKEQEINNETNNNVHPHPSKGGPSVISSHRSELQSDRSNLHNSLNDIKINIDMVHKSLTMVENEIDSIEKKIQEEEEKEATQKRPLALSSSSPSPMSQLLQNLSSARARQSAYKTQLTALHSDKSSLHQSLTNNSTQVAKTREDEFSAKENIRCGIIETSRIVCTTLSGAGMDIFSKLHKPFDYVIIDEAAQSVELSSLIPLQYHAKKCYLIGDPQQLPATVLSAHAAEWNYKQSLFQRLMKGGIHIEMLTIQYRMHREIRKFPSDYFYNGKLTDAKSLISSKVFTQHPAMRKQNQNNNNNNNNSPPPTYDMRLGPYVVFDLQYSEEMKFNSMSTCNQQEALFVLEIIKFLYKHLRHLHQNKNGEEWNNDTFIRSIGVISPYKLQVKEIKKVFNEYCNGQQNKNSPYNNNSFSSKDDPRSTAFNTIEVSTVDGFQGREKDYIIFSAVRARNHHHNNNNNNNNNNNSPSIGFISDASRLNVSLTRARYSLFVIGNFLTLSDNVMWNAMRENAVARNRMIIAKSREEGKDIWRGEPFNRREFLVEEGKEEETRIEYGKIVSNVETTKVGNGKEKGKGKGLGEEKKESAKGSGNAIRGATRNANVNDKENDPNNKLNNNVNYPMEIVKEKEKENQKINRGDGEGDGDGRDKQNKSGRGRGKENQITNHHDNDKDNHHHHNANPNTKSITPIPLTSTTTSSTHFPKKREGGKSIDIHVHDGEKEREKKRIKQSGGDGDGEGKNNNNNNNNNNGDEIIRMTHANNHPSPSPTVSNPIIHIRPTRLPANAVPSAHAVSSLPSPSPPSPSLSVSLSPSPPPSTFGTSLSKLSVDNILSAMQKKG